MLKKFAFLLLIFFSSFGVAHAGVVINEVQLFPTEERFIELYNDSAEDVDLSGWYIQRKTATGSSFGSLVSKTYFESKTIGARSYFVISRNSFPNSDIVLANLTLTESNAIQIKKSEEEIVDKISWGSSSECGGSCPSNPPEGKSIQKAGTSWFIEAPTRGVANGTIEEDSSPTSSSGSTPVSGGAVPEAKAKTAEVPKIKARITAKSISFSGLPLDFQANATGYEGEKLFYGKFFINFGDGDSKEMPANAGGNFSHTYLYPGDYIVTLEYYSSGNIPEASHQIRIKVVKSDIAISSVGDEKDFFVELTNNTDYEADISNWILSSAATSFTFPRNTIIGSKKKTIISSSFTNFSFNEKETLKLMTPQWKIIYDFSAVSSPLKETVKPIVNANQNVEREDASTLVEDPEVMPLENLAGAALLSDVSEESSSGSYLFTISTIMFVGASAGAVYFIRRKRVVPPGSDFKILDE